MLGSKNSSARDFSSGIEEELLFEEEALLDEVLLFEDELDCSLVFPLLEEGSRDDSLLSLEEVLFEFDDVLSEVDIELLEIETGTIEHPESDMVEIRIKNKPLFFMPTLYKYLFSIQKK